MKRIIHLFALIATGLMFSLFTSCEKESEWGIKKIYMPQAAITNNSNCEYPVPMTGQHDNNYRIEDGTLQVFLGVYRSGQGDLQSFSVDVYYDGQASAAAAIGTDRMVLPENTFSIPSTVHVKEGSRQNTFYMTVNLAKLRSEYPEYSEKKLVAVIGIANPTKYELNEDICKTTVVIDGSKFF